MTSLALVCCLGAAGLTHSAEAAEPPAEPFSIAVFTRDMAGYHTFRIPALLTTARGTVLAFAEGRRHGAGDAGDIDTAWRRSEDGGRTWSELRVLARGNGDTFGNPCPVQDRTTGRIWLALTWNKGSDSESAIMKGTSAHPRLVYMTFSDDDGQTWAEPRDVSKSVRRDHWRWYATGPGVGIQLTRGPHAGRLVLPCNHSDHSDPARHPYRSHVVYSDNHGATWTLGGVLEEKTNESTVAELNDGRVLDNMRSYHGRNRRAVATSADGGITWDKVQLDETLIEPVCQAALLRYSFAEEGGSRLLFSNPASLKRERMTVRMSLDDGQTWPVAREIWSGSSAYSSLARLPDGQVGLLYERNDYSEIAFTRFPISWLTVAPSR